MSKDDMAKAKVGVFWDINTCPIPNRSVRLRIESEMKKHIKAPFGVVVTCFGNLDYISPEILHDLARSGINLAHAPRGIHDIRMFLLKWSNETGVSVSDTVMLISGRYWWFTPSGLGWKGTVLHVRGVGEPEDAVLDNNPVDETNNPSDVASCVCYLCGSHSYDFIKNLQSHEQNSDDFIKHLQSNGHKEKTFWSSWQTDGKGNRLHFCKVCNYAGYDEDNMDIHYDSYYHKDKMELAEKEAQEENCKSGGDFMSEEHKEELEASRKRTGNQLLNEANKKR